MKLVVDDVVKMDWEASKCLYTQNPKLGKIFVFASKDYETPVGIITLFFTCETVFLWVSDYDTADEDRWNAKELKDYVKSNLDGSFPTQWNEYIPIVEFGSTEVVRGVMDKYQLGEYEQDILDRLEDVSGYAEEKPFDMSR